MSTDDPEQIPDGPSDDQLRETAAEREAHYWKGRRLETLSFGRQAACQRLMGDGFGPMENAVLLVYLCTLTDVEIDAVRTEGQRAEFRAQMNKWADAEGINLHNRGDVMQLADEIYGELAASSYKLAPKAPAKGSKPDSPPPNG